MVTIAPSTIIFSSYYLKLKEREGPFLPSVTGFSSKLACSFQLGQGHYTMTESPTVPDWNLNLGPPSLDANAHMTEPRKPVS